MTITLINQAYGAVYFSYREKPWFRKKIVIINSRNQLLEVPFSVEMLRSLKQHVGEVDNRGIKMYNGELPYFWIYPEWRITFGTNIVGGFVFR